MEEIKPGTEVFNRQTGEVMTFTNRVYNFTMRNGRPGVDTFAQGFDDFKRVHEWPYADMEKI